MIFNMEKMKFRKKPVVIEAYQTDKEMIIHTLEGDMLASPGDWIITGVNGEQYPCKPDIFEKTYEPADSESINTYEKMWNDLKQTILENMDYINDIVKTSPHPKLIHERSVMKNLLHIMQKAEIEK